MSCRSSSPPRARPDTPIQFAARIRRNTVAARLTDTAREAGAADPEQLGEQLALLLDGASARGRVLDSDSFASAAAIAVVLVDNALPTAAPPAGAGAVDA